MYTIRPGFFFTTLDCLQILKPFIWKKSLSIITATEDSCFNEFNFLQVNENLECVLDLMCHKSPQIKSSSNSFFFLSLSHLSLLPPTSPSPFPSSFPLPLSSHFSSKAHTSHISLSCVRGLYRRILSSVLYYLQMYCSGVSMYFCSWYLEYSWFLIHDYGSC